MPGVPGATVVTTLVCYLHFAHEAAGAAGTRHSPRPHFGREIHAQIGRIASRGRGIAPDVIASQRVGAKRRPMTGAAKQSMDAEKEWIGSSRSLSSGGDSASV